DKVLVEQLDEPLLYLVRNAVDHGIERPDEREAAGKPRAGTLSLSAFHRGNQIVVRLSDDGKGIDPERVREKAVRSGLVSAEAAAELDAEQVIDLIFHAGFSTREQVSDLSGRGVGMDVVRETLARLKGTVHVSSTLGQGTVFELRLPLTLAIVQVLLLRSAGQTFALPLDLVRRTLAVAPETLRLTGQQETLLEDGREIPLIRLDQLLRLPGAATEVPREAPVVLVEVGHQLVGLVCDAFLGRKEIVLKTLGSLLKRVPGAAGATLVGDRPAVILDVPALVSLAMTETPQAPRPEGVEGQAVGESEAPRGKARILVVEDTDVIRETLRRTLTRAGYEVVVARDGAEGLERARAERFDLVSTDVVMPGLDGYELTRRLRRLEGYRDVPILMVTSKAERIDRLRGFDAGVDAYLTKPTDAAELLRAIDEHLVSARFAR
ncbi:MAG TPA: response regulator, partial [Polyangiaceae bacterium LLY-WYZ-15_(1-7)]|nr:response regulator [Polyangiaceae bacterium LLY-WYZ-15_(1-7)]